MKLSLSKFSVCLSVLRMENSSPSSPGSNNKRFKFSQFDVSTDKKQFLTILLLSLVHLYRNLHFLGKNPALPCPWSSLSECHHCCLQVQGLIEQEVCRAMEKNETKLKGLIETIEHLDRNIERTIQKLEVGRRWEAKYNCIISSNFYVTYI